MSTLSTNKIIPATSTTVTLGDSGDTFALSSGASATGFGKVLQLITLTNGMKSDTFTTTSTSWTDVTDLSLSITPSSSSNFVVVSLHTPISNNYASARTHVQITRDGSAIAIGDAASSRTRGLAMYRGGDVDNVDTISTFFRDAPSSTSSLNYKVQMKVQSNTGVMNRNGLDGDADYTLRGITTFSLMEIGA